MDIPEVIYHYTTKETFLKIFSSDKPELRMYPANQMNDPMECKWLLQNILKLRRIPKDYSSLSKEAIISQIELDFIFSQTLNDYLNILHNMPHLLGSFTKNSGIEDGLTFWREYAQQGTGLAIGIASKLIIEQYPQLYCGSVSYENAQTIWTHLSTSFVNIGFQIYESLIKGEEYNIDRLKTDIDKHLSKNKYLTAFFELTNIFDFIIPKIENIFKQYKFLDLEKTNENTNILLIYKFVLLCLIHILKAMNCFIKQSAYSPEEEYRFILANLIADTTRIGNEVVFVSQEQEQEKNNWQNLIKLDPELGKSYFSLALDSDIIKEIIIGPNCPLSKLDVQMILKKHNITAYIKKSQIHMVQK